MKTFSILLMLLCLMTATGCGDTSSEISQDEYITADTALEGTASENCPQETTAKSELSAEIPAEAVTKKTEVTTVNDEISSITVCYLNNHADVLLKIKVNPETSEETIDSRIEYLYDENGSMSYEKINSRILGESENYYKYNENGDNIRVEGKENEKTSFELDMIYDSNHHQYAAHEIIYDPETDYNEILSDNKTDYSDCEFDDNGNITFIRYSNQKYSSVSMTYTEENYPLSSISCYSDYGKEEGADYALIQNAKYNDNGDLMSLDIILMPDPDTERIVRTKELRYDEEGRMIYIEDNYISKNKLTVTEYEYEDLKQAD